MAASREDQIASQMEKGSGWFADRDVPDSAEQDDAGMPPRAKELISEANARGAKAGRQRQRTSLMVINMRTIIEPGKNGDEDSNDR